MSRTSKTVCFTVLDYCSVSIGIYSISKFLFLRFVVKIVFKFVGQMIYLALGKHSCYFEM